MAKVILKRLLLPLMLPAFFLTLAWILLPFQQQLPTSLSGILLYAPYWFVAIVCTIGLFYNRSIITLATLLLGIGLYFFSWQEQQQTLTPMLHLLTRFSLVGLVLLNLALLSMYTERGAFSYHMLFRSGVILAQLALMMIIFLYPHSAPAALVEQQLLVFIKEPLFVIPVNWTAALSHFPEMHIADIYLVDVIVVISSITIILRAYLVSSAISFALMGATIGYLLGLYVDHPKNLLAVNVMVGSLLLCIAVLRDSYNMAYRDELTGLAQRRALTEQLLSLGSNYTLAMLDVDHFKKFNDKHGHDVGDQVLQMVAARIGLVKGGGKAYRYGGEEFAIVFPGGQLDDSLHHLEMVRKSIQDYEMVIRDMKRPADPGKEKDKLRERGSFKKADKKVSVTISIGAACRVNRGEAPEDVLKRADQALYKAKKAGRNKVMS